MTTCHVCAVSMIYMELPMTMSGCAVCAACYRREMPIVTTLAQREELITSVAIPVRVDPEVVTWTMSDVLAVHAHKPWTPVIKPVEDRGIMLTETGAMRPPEEVRKKLEKYLNWSVKKCGYGYDGDWFVVTEAKDLPWSK